MSAQTQETPTRVYVIIARNLDIPAHQWRGSVSGIAADGKNRAADFDNLGSGVGVAPAPQAQKFCMTTGRIAAHIAHVSMKMALLWMGAVEAHNCEVFVLQVANSTDFNAVCDRMFKAGIPFVRYHDTDRLWQGEQLTALCTFPLTESRCGAFADMKSYRCACNDARDEVLTIIPCEGIAPYDGLLCALRKGHTGEHSHIGQFRNDRTVRTVRTVRV